jgi:hypothetical protein
MGYDKFFFFISKNFTNKCYDTIYTTHKNNIITKNLFFDINYIIYKCIYDIENDINNIIKNILAIEYTDINIIKSNINEIYKNNHYLNIIEFSLNYNIFINNINLKINDLIYIKIFDYIYNTINNIYNIKYIESIHIFFDGIPSYSKILEQRKRRLKNFLISQYKKNNMINVNDYKYEDINIIYNYKKYINKIFSFNKNYGPKSKFLLNLSLYLKIKLEEYFKKVHIYDGLEYGEADFKILKELSKYKDVYIHSCDSDFLYFIILYYLKYNNNYKFIKYNNNNSYDIFKSKNIVNLIINKYKSINNIIDEININFIYDFLFLIQLFGNDIIPEVFELGIHINIKIYFVTHYILYKNNDFIINLNDNHIINYNNLSKWLSLLNNINLFSMKYLTKYFKLPYNFILCICQDLKYNVNQFINKLVIPYLNGNVNILNEINIDQKNKEYIQKCFTYIFDKTNKNDFGLTRKNISYEYSNDNYDTFYNLIKNNAIKYVYEKLNYDFIKKLNPKNCYKEYINYTNKSDIYNFFLVLTKQTEILFDINKYNPCNLFYCSSFYGPNINYIINYINKNDMSIFFNRQNNNNIYFNKLNHHIFITPYLYNSQYLSFFKNNYIKNILNILNFQVKGIIYDNNFILRDIDPILYLNTINTIINMFKIHNIIKLYKNNNLIYYNVTTKK